MKLGEPVSRRGEGLGYYPSPWTTRNLLPLSLEAHLLQHPLVLQTRTLRGLKWTCPASPGAEKAE